MYNVNYIDIKQILDDKFIRMILNSDIPSIYIFINMSWIEIKTYFRSSNYIVSGGKVSERHIMNDYKYLLAIFLKCINNINLPSNINNLYTSSSNLLDLFRYNTKDMMKYIKSNIDLTSKEINDDIIDNKIRFFYNDYDVSKILKPKMYNLNIDNIPLNNNVEYIKYNSEINHLFYDLNGINDYENIINSLDISKMN